MKKVLCFGLLCLGVCVTGHSENLLGGIIQAIAGTNGNPALISALMRDQADTVGKLIREGADVNAKGTRGETALETAINKGNTGFIKQLLEAGANMNARGISGTALQCAVAKGDLDIIKLLIAAGARVNNYLGQYVGTVLESAINKGDADIIRLLAEAGVKMDTRAMEAALRDGKADLIKLLIAEGVDMNVKGLYGETPLMIAVIYENSDTVKLLIAAKADVNVKVCDIPPDASYKNHDFRQKEDKNIPLMLLKAGAFEGFVHEGGGMQHSDDAYTGRPRVTENPTIGATALMLASYIGNTGIAKALIEAGADVDAKSQHEFYKTALALAKFRKHADIVLLLEAAGAK